MRAATRGVAARAALAPGGAAAPKWRVYPNLGLVLGTVDKKGLDGLKKDDRVRSVTFAPQLSLIRPVAASETKATGDVTWGLSHLEIPKLWDQGITGKGVLVGHLDTGIDGDHPALKNAIQHFEEFDFLGNPVPGATPRDSWSAWDPHRRHHRGPQGTFHGVRGRSRGDAGQGRCRNRGGRRDRDPRRHGLGRRTRGEGVLSMSLGLPGFHPDFLPVTQILRARGILPVFAVGNEGAGTSRSPGNYAEALSVVPGMIRMRSPTSRPARRSSGPMTPTYPT